MQQDPRQEEGSSRKRSWTSWWCGNCQPTTQKGVQNGLERTPKTMRARNSEWDKPSWAIRGHRQAGRSQRHTPAFETHGKSSRSSMRNARAAKKLCTNGQFKEMWMPQKRRICAYNADTTHLYNSKTARGDGRGSRAGSCRIETKASRLSDER